MTSPQAEAAKRADLTRRAIRIAKAYVRVVRAQQGLVGCKMQESHNRYREHAEAVKALRSEVDALGPEGLDGL